MTTLAVENPAPAGQTAMQPMAVNTAEPIVEIVPSRGWMAIDWKELWEYRELLGFLVWRDVKVKYKMAVLGFAWAVFVPILFALMFTAFGNAANLSDHVKSAAPYMVYMLAALVPWRFFSDAITKGGQSLVSEQRMIGKIYMPRLYVPLSSVGSSMVDMGIAMGVLAGVMLLYGFVPSWQIIFLPLLLGLTFMCATGLVLALSALTAMYRDLRFVVPFIVQAGLFLSAVPFPPDVFGPSKHYLALNPIAGIIATYRTVLLGEPWEPLMLLGSVVFSTAILVFGLFYFRRVERRIADII